MSTDLTELNKLEAWLMLHRIQYERKDLPAIYDEKGLNIRLEKHQICVPVENVAERSWDAICHPGSYGYEQGLLEIMGDLVDCKKDGDTVVGYLTAEEVIERFKNYGNHRKRSNR